jgi:hypothetical protein
LLFFPGLFEFAKLRQHFCAALLTGGFTECRQVKFSAGDSGGCLFEKIAPPLLDFAIQRFNLDPQLNRLCSNDSKALQLGFFHAFAQS